jgi:hypothetical protein
LSDLEQFQKRYERHVANVAQGNMKAALAEMVQANLPAVFDGVDVPRADVHRFEIQGVRADGNLMIGETIYDVDDRRIGLRSIWENHDGEWLAARLENFAVSESAS